MAIAIITPWYFRFIHSHQQSKEPSSFSRGSLAKLLTVNVGQHSESSQDDLLAVKCLDIIANFYKDL